MCESYDFLLVVYTFFCFKQKTAYEMRISAGVQTCALPIYYAVESGDEYGDACTEHDIPARVRAMAEREMQTAQHRPGKEQDQRGQTDPAQFGAGEDRKSTRLNSSH